MQIRAVAAIALFFAAVSASAQFTPCAPPPTLGLRHIFVDDFRFADEAGAPATMKRVRDALLVNIKNQIDSLPLQKVPHLKAVPCAGLRAVENKDYDFASAYLCRGLGELQRVAQKTPDDVKLLTYVDAAKRKIVADARADGAYGGALRLPGAETRCTR